MKARKGDLQFSSPDARRRAAAVLATGKLPNGGRVLESHINECLRDRSSCVRAVAALQAGAHRLREAVPHLLAGLRDPDWRVRLACCVALEDILGGGSLPYWQQACKDESRHVAAVARERAAFLRRHRERE